MAISKLTEEAEQIQAFLEITCSDDPNEMVSRLSDLSVYMARTGKMLADAKMLLRARKSTEIRTTILAIAKEACLSGKAQNALVDSIAEDEAYLVDWVDRLNRTCTHLCENLRTQISYAKQQMQSLSGMRDRN